MLAVVSEVPAVAPDGGRWEKPRPAVAPGTRWHDMNVRLARRALRRFLSFLFFLSLAAITPQIGGLQI